MCEGEWNSFPRQDQLEKEAVQTCAQRQQCNATILQVIDNYFTIKFDICTVLQLNSHQEELMIVPEFYLSVADLDGVLRVP